MITFGSKRTEPTTQFNCRMPVAVFKLIEDGCRETGMSQAKFVALCIAKQSREIPALTRDLQRAVWDLMAKDMVNGALKK